MERETCTCSCPACRACEWETCLCGARVPAGDTGLCVLCEEDRLTLEPNGEVEA